MTAPRHIPIKWLAPLIAFAATIATIAVLNRASDPARQNLTGGGSGGFSAQGRSTEQQIEALQQALRDGPPTADRYAQLGTAYLQRARETFDASFSGIADGAFRKALARAGSNPAALAGMASLSLARHDFSGGLRFAQRAHAVAPGVVRIYGPMVDGLVELGRYDEAQRTLQRMVDRKPNIASYSRVSYLRELHGDLAGAAAAMRLAVAAGGDTRENASYVQTLLGNIELQRGHLKAAERAYETALSRFPGYAPAVAGSARLAVARGDLAGAIRRLRPVVERTPLPEYAIALAETEQAAGRPAAAADHFALVQVEQRLLARNGVNTDAELAVFEADHGNAAVALTRARRAWAAAPSVRSADALGWALTRTGKPAEGLRWSRRALELGSRDHLFLYHAGIAARGAGEPAAARRYLTGALAGNPRFAPLQGPRAQHALERLR